jgi:hypothetical protein
MTHVHRAGIPTSLATLAALLASALMAGCNRDEAPAAIAPTADTIYSGGDILTLVGNEPQSVEALAVREGRILMTGTRAEVMKRAGPATLQVDLAGKTLMPGIIDAHSHLLNHADSLLQAPLNAPPIGKIESIADIVTALQTLKATRPATDTSVLIGQGYDQDTLKERRHPDAADLDRAFPDQPVVILHVSGHMLVANSAALKAAGISAATTDPEGGAILRKKGSREPQGLVQETAMHAFIGMIKGQRTPEAQATLLRQSIAHYAANGVTTAAEHLLLPGQPEVLEAAADQGLFTIDVVATPAYMMADQLVGTGAMRFGEYRKGLKYGGIKLALDGSPQGKTAFITEPYLTAVPGCVRNCKGLPSIPQAEVNRLVLLAYRNRVPVFAHANGDGAIDMLIKAHEEAEKTLGETSTDRRTVVIHSQIMRPDQMDAYKRLGLLPSFFTNHVFYWGDTHLANLGQARADYLSPLKSAIDAGIHASNHTDNIVTPLDPMFLLWTSVNRVTLSGKVLGESERVTPWQGLRALTIHAAFDYREEQEKGSLEAGKLADLVILSANPLKVDPMTIRDIKVVETIKTGKTVFRAP